MHGPPKEPPDGDELIPPHGGYRKLKSFQMAELCFDVTARFCKRYVDRRSRTYDQMVQAARSGTQNIVEGSAASGTSKRTEMKLTDTARFSLEELRRDYRDYLRQRGLKEWSYREPLRRFRGRSTRSSRSPTFNRTFRPMSRQRRGFLNSLYSLYSFSLSVCIACAASAADNIRRRKAPSTSSTPVH